MKKASRGGRLQIPAPRGHLCNLNLSLRVVVVVVLDIVVVVIVTVVEKGFEGWSSANS